MCDEEEEDELEPEPPQRWTKSRLTIALRLMALLPTNEGSGLTFEGLMLELRISSDRKLYRLISDMKKAGIDIETSGGGNVRRVYFLSKAARHRAAGILRS